MCLHNYVGAMFLLPLGCALDPVKIHTHILRKLNCFPPLRGDMNTYMLLSQPHHSDQTQFILYQLHEELQPISTNWQYMFHFT